MVTKISITNFKKFEHIELQFKSTVVLVGPNNSGKTTALQALSLWELGLRKWQEYKRQKPKSNRKSGLTVNRQEVLSIPTTEARQLWKDLHVRDSFRDDEKNKQMTVNVLIRIVVEGIYQDLTKTPKIWKIGMEFDYANPESLYCRIMDNPQTGQAYDVYQDINYETIGFLHPMSGINPVEDKLEKGSIHARIGEGRTAEILRNLCYIVAQDSDKWVQLHEIIKKQFDVSIEPPGFNRINGTLSMSYRQDNHLMDITNSGRGFQQILLVFSYIFAFPNSILLIDEPDAHLENIRQKELFRMLKEMTAQNNSQLFIATHSESVLNEATESDDVIAFIGNAPHQANSKKEIVKSLCEIGFENYLSAEKNGWILYLEGSTDLNHLIEYAKLLNHPVEWYLDHGFIHYVSTDKPGVARRHFTGLKEAKDDLIGIALFDRISSQLNEIPSFTEMMWERYEIENYLPLPEILERYVINKKEGSGLFGPSWDRLIIDFKDNVPPSALNDHNNSFWVDTKISRLLDQVFRMFFEEFELPISLMDKGKYHLLIGYLKPEEVHPEVIKKLDEIYGQILKVKNLQEKS